MSNDATIQLLTNTRLAQGRATKKEQKQENDPLKRPLAQMDFPPSEAADISGAFKDKVDSTATQLAQEVAPKATSEALGRMSVTQVAGTGDGNGTSVVGLEQGQKADSVAELAGAIAKAEVSQRLNPNGNREVINYLLAKVEAEVKEYAITQLEDRRQAENTQNDRTRKGEETLGLGLGLPQDLAVDADSSALMRSGNIIALGEHPEARKERLKKESRRRDQEQQAFAE